MPRTKVKGICSTTDMVIFMNLEILKDVFFIGEQEKIDELIGTFKTRCIQPTSFTVDAGNGVQERVVYNSEKDEYISQHMNVYKICPHCGRLEKEENIVTVTISPDQRKRPEGRRNFQKTETLCKQCLEANDFVVRHLSYDEYLYADNENTWTYHSSHNQIKYGTYYDFSRSATSQRNIKRFDPETNDWTSLDGNERQLYHDDLCVRVKYVSNSRTYTNIVLKSEIAAHPEFYTRCSHCHNLWLARDLEDGKCLDCLSVFIYSYHGWDEDLNFLKSDEDSDDEKMYFGTEVETVGNEANRNCIRNYQDIWHLERDGSLDYGGFEMISQPMTYKYICENHERFEKMFQMLTDSGQKSHDSTCCGLHIHVSKDAFKSEEAIDRAVAIVNCLSDDVKKFARRGENQYCKYDFLPEIIRKSAIDRERHGRYAAVNCEQERHNEGTIEFRMFRGTLNPVTYFAAIELVRNIVNVANDLSKVEVKFTDLLDGNYIPQYIESRKQYSSNFTFSDKTVKFYAYQLDVSYENLISGDLSVSSFEELLHNLMPATQAVALEGGVA